MITYYCLIVNIFFINKEIMFKNDLDEIFSIIFLTIFHLMLILIIYCFFKSMYKDPGQPPKFWGFNHKPDE